MNATITSVDQLEIYYNRSLSAGRMRAFAMTALSSSFFWLLGFFGQRPAMYSFAAIAVISIVIFHRRYFRNEYRRIAVLKSPFPSEWSQILENHVVFYSNLNPSKRLLFEKRVQIFLSEKKVEGIDTEVDDTIRLLVAASAIIPTFAFPVFTYPELSEVLIYPKSFSKKFDIDGSNKRDQNIEGMVGNRYMNHSLLLSKPALLGGFTGRNSENNVGIHEFVHLLDREDGDTDGIPEKLMEHDYVLPWLHLIKKETDRIKKGRSDINPYAITNNAEFLAVVSEYFFNDPEDFAEKYPELYSFLSDFYDQKLRL